MGDSEKDKMIMKVALFFKALLFHPKDIVKTMGELHLNAHELLAACANESISALESALTRLVVAVSLHIYCSRK